MKKIADEIDNHKFWLLFVFVSLLFGATYLMHSIEKRDDKKIITKQDSVIHNQLRFAIIYSEIIINQKKTLDSIQKILQINHIMLGNDSKMLKSIYYYQNKSKENKRINKEIKKLKK